MEKKVKDILAELEANQDEKVRKHNKKFGAGDNQFGVKKGVLRKVAKKIKANQDLALALWETGNIDARLVAVLSMKPKALSADQVDTLVRSVGFVHVADWLNAYVVKLHPENESLRVKWMKSSDPMAARAGWSLTAGRVARDPEGLDLAGLLDRLESEMGQANKVTQWTMNNTLVGIGIHHPSLRQRALDIGEKLGVYSEIPNSNGCTSPFAPLWINEMVKREAQAK